MTESNLSSSNNPGVASIIRSLRKLKGMTLKELSESTGMSDGYLSLMERGERPISEENFYKIVADAFGYPRDVVDVTWKKVAGSKTEDQKQASRSIARTKYKVICRGFSYDNYGYLTLMCRWTIGGKIYYWNFYNENIVLNENDPLTGNNNNVSWEFILELLGKKETLVLLDALLNEIAILKDAKLDDSENAMVSDALAHIEDLLDAIETRPEESVQYTSEVKVEDLPF